MDENKAMLVGAVIAVALLLTAGGFRGGRERGYSYAEDAKDGEYVGSANIPGSGEDEGRKETSYFTIQVNSSPEVPSGSKRCNLMIGNPAENEQYVKVKLILDDTGEELFCSEILKPGERNAFVELEEVPEAGENAATAVFMVYDPESMEQITEIEAGVLLTVEK